MSVFPAWIDGMPTLANGNKWNPGVPGGIPAGTLDATLTSGQITTNGINSALANAATTFGARAQHHTPMSEVTGLISSGILLPITATAAGSWIIGVLQWGNLPDAGSFFPYDANTTINYQAQDGGSDGGAAAFRLTGVTDSSALCTLGVTASQYAWSMSATEILKAP